MARSPLHQLIRLEIFNAEPAVAPYMCQTAAVYTS